MTTIQKIQAKVSFWSGVGVHRIGKQPSGVNPDQWLFKTAERTELARNPPAAMTEFPPYVTPSPIDYRSVPVDLPTQPKWLGSPPPSPEIPAYF